MKCKLCAAVLPEDAAECPACGQPVAEGDTFAPYEDAAQPLGDDLAEEAPAQPRQVMPQEEPIAGALPGNPYAMPVQTPNPIMQALCGLPQFLRALVTEPKTTLGTMLSRADVFSGLLGIALFLLLAVLGSVMLGTGAARINIADPSLMMAQGGHVDYLAALFSALKFFSVGRLLVWLLVFALVTAGVQMLWQVVLKHRHFTWALLTTGLCYALLPIGAIALPAGLCALFSPVLGLALTLGGVVMSLYLTGYVLRHTGEEQESDATVFLAAVPAVAIVVLTLLLCALLA